MNDTAKVRLTRFIDSAKSMLEAKIQARMEAGITVGIDWSSVEWSLKGIAHDANPAGGSLMLAFCRYEMAEVDGRLKLKRDRTTRRPLLPWLGDVARAVCAYYLCEEGKSWVMLKTYLNAFRWLDEVVRVHPVEGLHELLPHHLDMINSWMDRSMAVAETKSSVGLAIVTVTRLLNKFGLTDQRVSYVNPYDRDGSAKKDRTIGADAIGILYYCINNPVDDDERILMELLRLHLASGNRISETLTTPADSYFKRSGTTLRQVEQENRAAKFNYGLAYFRRKSDGGAKIRALDQGAYKAVKIAADTLHRLCASARSRAKLLAEMPGRFPLPKLEDGTEFYAPDEFVTSRYIMEVIGYREPTRWLASKNVRSYTRVEAQACGWDRDAPLNIANLYLVADVERACLTDVDLVVLRNQDGTPKLWLHDTLCVVFVNQLNFAPDTKHRTRTLFPERVKLDKIGGELTSGKKPSQGVVRRAPSIFERRGLTLPDGSPIRIGTHQSRHTRNRFLDEAGLSQIQQGYAMGRDPVQNKSYQGGSDTNIIQASHLERLRKTEHSARTAVVKDAVRDRLIEGAITDAYHRLRDLDVVKAEEFLEEQVGQVLVTRFGACTNEWSGQSCPKHNKCFKRCKSYHVTGVESERIELDKELRIQRLHRAKVKELADEGVYRADTALHNLDNEIASIEEAMAQWQRAADRRKALESNPGTLGKIPISVQVYPDGVSHYKEMKRTADRMIKEPDHASSQISHPQAAGEAKADPDSNDPAKGSRGTDQNRHGR